MNLRILDVIPNVGFRSNGACDVCSTGQRKLDGGRLERVVALGFDIEAEGEPVICETCLGFVARDLGWIREADATDLRATAQEALASEGRALARAERAESELADVYDSIKKLRLPVERKPKSAAALTPS